MSQSLKSCLSITEVEKKCSFITNCKCTCSQYKFVPVYSKKHWRVMKHAVHKCGEQDQLMRKGSAVLSPQANLCSVIQKYNSEKRQIRLDNWVD